MMFLGSCGTAAALSLIEPKVSTIRLQSHTSYNPSDTSEGPCCIWTYRFGMATVLWIAKRQIDYA